MDVMVVSHMFKKNEPLDRTEGNAAEQLLCPRNMFAKAERHPLHLIVALAAQLKVVVPLEQAPLCRIAAPECCTAGRPW